MPANQPKIIIVGAGASGVAAATKLLENGFDDVIILEAENRVGGRVCSVEFGGTIVDIGGQWVHGENGNIVYEMVKDLDLLRSSKLPQDPGMSYFLVDGSVPDRRITDRLYTIAMEVKDDKASAGSRGGSFADYWSETFNSRVEEEFGSSNKEVSKLANLVEEWFKKIMILFNPAANWEQLSTTSHYVFRPCDGDQMLGWGNKGYKTIFDVMTKKIPDPSQVLTIDEKIILNKEINKIIWNQNSEHKVTVKCPDGSVYTADHVIVTVSVGVLKETYKKMFVPALPKAKINSIEGVPLGTVNKILLKFPIKWWPDNVKDISFLWSEDEKEELIKEFSHGPVVNGRSWLENLFSFIAIDSHPNILLGWVNGPTAKLVELLSDDIVKDGAMYMLRKFAGKSYEIPEPDGIYRSKWGSNPHFRGSYAYVNSDMEKRNASADDLAKPLTVDGIPVVLFAGEATHPFLFSTVNGAMETGYREAERLMILYEK